MDYNTLQVQYWIFIVTTWKPRQSRKSSKRLLCHEGEKPGLLKEENKYLVYFFHKPLIPVYYRWRWYMWSYCMSKDMHNCYLESDFLYCLLLHRCHQDALSYLTALDKHGDHNELSSVFRLSLFIVLCFVACFMTHHMCFFSFGAFVFPLKTFCLSKRINNERGAKTITQ